MKHFCSIFFLVVSFLLLGTVGVIWLKASTWHEVRIPGPRNIHRMQTRSFVLMGNESKSFILTAYSTNFVLSHLSPEVSNYPDGYHHFHSQQKGFVFLGNGFMRLTYHDGGDSSHILVSYWLVMLVAAVLPVRWLTGSLRRRLRSRERTKRLRHGQCPACGYNLTANTSGICPECGKAIKASIT